MTTASLLAPAAPQQTPMLDRAAQLAAQLRPLTADVLGLPTTSDAWDALADRYFVRARAILAQAGRDPVVTVQIFAKHAGVLAGIPEVLRLLEVALTPAERATVLVETRLEGDAVVQWEPVLRLTLPYRLFAPLETPIIGVLARRTLVASNTRTVVEAAAGRPIIYMAPRHDDWRVQAGDGYAALLGGAAAVSSDEAGRWMGQRGVGTMPHALIAAFGGDTVAATLALGQWAQTQAETIPVVSLVDYHNDCVGTAVAVAQAMAAAQLPLSAVRLDTSERLVDRSLEGLDPARVDHALTGVNPALVRAVRAGLDAAGFPSVGILVSGGFTPEKIRDFVARDVPVSGFGVGSSLLGHNRGTDGLRTGFDFTADLVTVDGAPQHKVGRPGRPVADAVVGTLAELLARADVSPAAA